MLGLIGAKIAGKVVTDTCRQAVKGIAKNVSSGPARKPGHAGMDLDEALRILNIPKTAPRDEMIQRYQKMFELNDRKTGGSFYLQSKIVRARERLEMEYNKTQSSN